MVDELTVIACMSLLFSLYMIICHKCGQSLFLLYICDYMMCNYIQLNHGKKKYSHTRAKEEFRG